jgi:sugar lactone lactonase YvrE
VADFNNSRVLGFANEVAFVNNQAAIIVIGQPDLFSGGCNSTGINAASLCNPAGVAVDSSNNLYVSDFNNNRVMEYNTPFTRTAVAGSGDAIADNVFGQGGDFTSDACDLNGSGPPDADSLCNPDGLFIDRAGSLWVADQSNNRVLQYFSPPFNTTATFELGQLDFVSSACNMGSVVSSSSLCNPTDVTVDSAGNVYVTDFNNNRVLLYRRPLSTGSHAANLEFGQGSGSSAGTDFSDNTCNFGNVINPGTLCHPNWVALDANLNLYVADFSNNRTLEYNTPLTRTATAGSGDTLADHVFGQADDFNVNGCNFGGAQPSAASQCNPTGVVVDSLGDVLVADRANNRVLKYDPPYFSPRALPFGKVAVKSIAVKNIYLVNTQGVWLNKISLSLTGSTNFRISANSCGTSLGPHLNCKLSITFSPTSTGLKSATLTARDDAPNAPQRATVTGSGY